MVVLRGSEVLELQDVTFTPTRDADGNVLYGTDFRVEPMKKDLRHVIVMTCDMYIYYSRAILGSFFDLLAGKVGVEDCPAPSARCRRSTRPCTTAGGRYCPCWLC